jgi:hypothetical protein
MKSKKESGLKISSDELRRRQQRKALRETAGAWKDKDHPELKNGAAAWIHQMREADKSESATAVAGWTPTFLGTLVFQSNGAHLSPILKVTMAS